MKTFSIALAVMLMSCITFMSRAQDNLAPSQNPPGGLSVSESPMFVGFGFDDNYFSGWEGSGGTGGMKWIMDYTRNLNNPPGTGQGTTLDGAPVRCTFFVTTEPAEVSGAESGTYVKKAWRQAFDDGHELGNHTFSHSHGSEFDETDWRAEILRNESLLFKPFDAMESVTTPDTSAGVGISKSDYYGFRTPFLEYSVPLFNELKNLGYLYDCSIEEGYEPDQTGSNNFWPYTLDGGSPGHDVLVEWGLRDSLAPVPGLWEMPAYTLIVPPDELCTYYGAAIGLRNKIKTAMDYFDVAGGKMTGFDYNMMAGVADGGANLNKEEVLAIFKYSFDIRYYGNRAPMLIGAHTTYYSSFWNEAPAIPSVADRQWIMESLISYMLEKPEVRVVPYIDILNWIKQPAALGDLPGPFTLDVTATNGTVNVSPVTAQYQAGETVTLTAVPDEGYEFGYYYGGAEGGSDSVTITMTTDVKVLAVFRETSVSCDSIVRVFDHATIASEKDNIGSTIAFTTEGELAVDWSMPKRIGENWPWLDVQLNLPVSLYGLCGIELTYSSDQPLVLSLPQAPLSSTGESYGISLPKVAGYANVSKSIDDFAQPSWATNKPDLNLGAITNIMISPDVDTQGGALSGAFAFSNIILYGLYIEPNSIQEANALNLNIYASEGQVVMQIPDPGTYLVNIFTTDGKLVYATKKSLPSGDATVLFGKRFPTGIYVVRVQHEQGVTAKKLFVNP